jgi:hypothetical protein
MSQKDFAARLQRFVDTQEISHVIANHSRGIDRADLATFDDVYHPDGDVAYGFFDGSSAEFARVVTDGADDMPGTMHRPSNVWVEVDGDRAKSESYVTVYTHAGDETGATSGETTFIGGRYLDRFERRDRVWKMTHRTYVMDWNLNQPGTGSTMPGFDAAPRIQGLKGPSDFSIDFLAAQDTKTSGKEDAAMVDVSAELATRAQEAFAKQDIHELIMGQARAIDRADVDLFKSLWFDDATVNIADFQGSGVDFVDMILDATRDMKRMAHSIANEWIKVDGDTARSECYMIAFTTVAGENGDQDTLTGGRYLDAFERREGVWKYTHRAFVQDWEINQPSSDKGDEGMLATLTTRAASYPDDAVYKFWNA